MKPKKKRPLRVHLAIGFLIFSALLLVVLWIFQTVFLESFYKTIKTQQVKSCTYSLTDYIETSDFYDLVSDIEEQNNMTVGVYNTDDSIFSCVYNTQSHPGFNSDIANKTIYDLYEKASQNNGEHSTITNVIHGQRSDKPVMPENFEDLEELDLDDQKAYAEGDNEPMQKQEAVKTDLAAQGAEPPEADDDADTDDDRDDADDVEPAPQNNDPAFQNGQPIDPANGANNQYQGVSPVYNNGTQQQKIIYNATEPTISFSTADEALYNQKHEPSLERESSQILAYAKIINTSAGERMIVVESEITPVNSVVETLRIQLIIMTVVILILSIVVAIFLGKYIAQPISDTNEQAKALAKQDYDITFSGGRYREITELNETLTYAAGELKKVDSLQKELIANISHDLRTPLTMITGYSEVMRDLPGEMTPENIQIIIDEATRLNSLVTDLLDISRLQSGTADVKKAPFSLTECIESIFARYTKLIENDGLNIVFEHDREVFIMGDELRMTQVLYNLINNAINYIGEDKTVIVRQTVEDEKVRVDVIDHGDGIPEEKLKYIWDRYYRVDKEHRRAVIGTGLGLSIVKNILIAHDAEFNVTSTLGEGSDFYFILPIIPTDEE